MARVFAQHQHAATRSSVAALFPISNLKGNIRLLGSRLEFDQMSHDVYALHYVGSPTYLHDTLRTGTPLEITVESELGSKTFPSYVHHVEQSSENLEGGQPTSTVMCVGASYPLKVKGTRTWSNASVSQIVTDIASMFHLEPNVDPCTYIYTTYMQANRSYWEVLRELADKFGYILRVDGTTLRFLKPSTATRVWHNEAPVLNLQKSQSAGQMTFGTPLVQFSMTSGQLMTADQSWAAPKVVRGIDASTGTPFTISSSEADSVRQGDNVSPFDDLMTTHASSVGEARHFADGAARRDRYAYNGRALTLGNPFVTSDRSVYLNGTGNTDGFWVVRKAYHDIDVNGSYRMTLDLGADGLGNTLGYSNESLVPTKRPLRDLSAESRGVSTVSEQDWYLYRSSVTPVAGQTGAQYVTAEWRHRTA
jgi:phage protein D